MARSQRPGIKAGHRDSHALMHGKSPPAYVRRTYQKIFFWIFRSAAPPAQSHHPKSGTIHNNNHRGRPTTIPGVREAIPTKQLPSNNCNQSPSAHGTAAAAAAAQQHSSTAAQQHSSSSGTERNRRINIYCNSRGRPNCTTSNRTSPVVRD